MRNIFLQKSCGKCGRETSGRHLFSFKRFLYEKKFLKIHLLYLLYFSRKYFSCYINLTDQISLFDCLFSESFFYIMRIVIICFPVYDVINFENNLSFLINQDKNLNILRRKGALKVTWETLFIVFKGLSVARICLRPEGKPLISMSYMILQSH